MKTPSDRPQASGSARPVPAHQSADYRPKSEADLKAVAAAKQYIEQSGSAIPADVDVYVQRAEGKVSVFMLERPRPGTLEWGGYEREVRMSDPGLQLIEILVGQ